MSGHVPTPWFTQQDAYANKWVIHNEFETFVDIRSGLGGLNVEATAKFIVKACNSYDDLVENLELAIALFGPVCNGGMSGRWLKDAMSTIDGLAKGGQP